MDKLNPKLHLETPEKIPYKKNPVNLICQMTFHTEPSIHKSNTSVKNKIYYNNCDLRKPFVITKSPEL